MWYRVFGSNDSPVDSASLLGHLQGQGFDVTARFRGDDQGWFHAELQLDGEEEPVKLERYLASEPGIRAELNTWAAWLESVPHNPHQTRLMQQMIATRQVFTLVRPPLEDDDQSVHNLCLATCRYLAEITEGVYQTDGHGFFDTDGTLLVKES